ncbi:MAG TPA: hypothetical protein VFT22_14475 [Kofleriaceae bacterium]|nr:hypothetical protein [Kofleriaceae bacterium]
MRPALGALAVAWCAAQLACSGAQKMAASPAPTQAAGAADPHAEIAALDRQIADEMARAHLAPPPLAGCSGAACAEAMSRPFALPACRPKGTDRCSDACTLATSICDNQQKICDLAGKLAGDDWAAGKCESARASCQAAHDSCCSCVL